MDLLLALLICCLFYQCNCCLPYLMSIHEVTNILANILGNIIVFFLTFMFFPKNDLLLLFLRIFILFITQAALKSSIYLCLIFRSVPFNALSINALSNDILCICFCCLVQAIKLQFILDIQSHNVINPVPSIYNLLYKLNNLCVFQSHPI